MAQSLVSEARVLSPSEHLDGNVRSTGRRCQGVRTLSYETRQQRCRRAKEAHEGRPRFLCESLMALAGPVAESLANPANQLSN
jgi:hypothetical protein